MSRDPELTRKIIREELASYPTKMDLKQELKRYAARYELHSEINQLEITVSKRVKKYRDQILDKIDIVLRESSDMRIKPGFKSMNYHDCKENQTIMRNVLRNLKSISR